MLGREEKVEPIRTVSEYKGQAVLRVAATQLGTVAPSQARRIVAEWIEFFSSGPSAIQELHFVTRTPKRLFQSLASQTQLHELHVKWGDYEDLSALSALQSLETLVLGGASSVRTVAPLTSLARVTNLQIESLRRVSDLSPLAQMTSVTALTLGGDWIAPRNAHVDSIAFLRSMPQLKSLLLHTIIVDDKDYSPLLDLPHLKQVRVMATRGMSPSIDELKATLPWNE